MHLPIGRRHPVPASISELHPHIRFDASIYIRFGMLPEARECIMSHRMLRTRATVMERDNRRHIHWSSRILSESEFTAGSLADFSSSAGSESAQTMSEPETPYDSGSLRTTGAELQNCIMRRSLSYPNLRLRGSVRCLRLGIGCVVLIALL